MHKRKNIYFQQKTQFNRYTLHFPFTNCIYTSKYNHFIEPSVGQKVTSKWSCKLTSTNKDVFVRSGMLILQHIYFNFTCIRFLNTTKIKLR